MHLTELMLCEIMWQWSSRSNILVKKCWRNGMVVTVDLTLTRGDIAPFIIFTNNVSPERLRLSTWLACESIWQWSFKGYDATSSWFWTEERISKLTVENSTSIHNISGEISGLK